MQEKHFFGYISIEQKRFFQISDQAEVSKDETDKQEDERIVEPKY